MHTHLLNLSKSYLNQFKGLSSNSWQGIYLSLIESSLMGVFYFISVYFVNELNINMAQAGTLISLYGIGAMLGSYLTGKLSCRISPHTTVYFSLFFQAGCYLCLAFCTSLPILSATLLILGTASYSFITANHLCVLANCQQKQQLKAINLLSTAANLGLAISAIAVSSLIRFGFFYIFINAGIILFIMGLYLSTKRSHQPISKPTESTSDTSMTQLKHQRRMLTIILCCVFLTGSIVSQIGAGYAIYIHDHFPSGGIHGLSILFAINSLMVVFLETPLGNLCTESNKLKLIGIASFLIGLGMFLLILSHQFVLAMAACVIYTLGEIIFFCLTQYACYRLSSQQNPGEGLGYFRLVYAASRIAGPIAGGMIYHHAGGDALWVACGVLGTVCMLGCFTQVKYKFI